VNGILSECNLKGIGVPIHIKPQKKGTCLKALEFRFKPNEPFRLRNRGLLEKIWDPGTANHDSDDTIRKDRAMWRVDYFFLMLCFEM
jgi:hypothetical protein